MQRTRDLPPSRAPRHIVSYAPVKASAVYLFDSDPDDPFWRGEVVIQLGDDTYSAQATMRSPKRAIVEAMRKAAEAILNV